jgi:hypothetical protein
MASAAARRKAARGLRAHGGGARPAPNFRRPILGPPAKADPYGGLDEVLARLSGGVNQQQFGRMAEGRTGGHGWGAVGGMGGDLSGLSPYAVNFLTTMMEKKAANHQALDEEYTNPEGVVGRRALEGDALWKATLMNNLADQNALANPTYQLHSGVDEGFLAQIFGQGFGGNSAYEKGYGAEGRLPQQGPVRKIRPWRPHKGVRRPLR